MNENDLPAAVVDRLIRVRALEELLLERVEGLAPAAPMSSETAEWLVRARALALGHLQAIDDLATARAPDLGHAQLPRGNRDSEPPVSLLVEEVANAAASVVTAWGALYAAARLLYESEVCKLADAHGAAWRHEIQAIGDLMVAEVHGELLRGGLTCRCICPACGIGACLCTRNSIDTIRRHWGQAGLESGDGIELRIPPRPGSQLAEAGLGRGDRILAVEGEVVHDNAEVQRALRRHPIGEAMPIQVERDGRADELRVARVSDLPS